MEATSCTLDPVQTRSNFLCGRVSKSSTQVREVPLSLLAFSTEGMQKADGRDTERLSKKL